MNLGQRSAHRSPSTRTRRPAKAEVAARRTDAGCMASVQPPANRRCQHDSWLQSTLTRSRNKASRSPLLRSRAPTPISPSRRSDWKATVGPAPPLGLRDSFRTSQPTEPIPCRAQSGAEERGLPIRGPLGTVRGYLPLGTTGKVPVAGFASSITGSPPTSLKAALLHPRESAWIAILIKADRCTPSCATY